jgi:poly(beta-D-mannuronate) lyase
VVTAADAYRATGSRAAAECAVNLLVAAAERKVLSGRMDGHQASYVQGWNLGAWAVAWLKVRESRVAGKQQETGIRAWLKKLAEENRGYYEAKRRGRRPNDADNNHLYWAGFAIAAAGIADDDRHLFAWGVAAYRQGIGDIRGDGTLPMEMARGQMALHYHLYALAPLVFLAELGEANGLDLYAERDFAIRRLVARCVAGLEDPAFFERQTAIAQVPQEIGGLEASWGTVWTRRFPDTKINALISQARYRGYTELGGLPPP